MDVAVQQTGGLHTPTPRLLLPYSLVQRLFPGLYPPPNNPLAPHLTHPLHPLPCGSWVERLFPGLYPRFLHVLRVDPTRLDAVK